MATGNKNQWQWQGKRPVCLNYIKMAFNACGTALGLVTATGSVPLGIKMVFSECGTALGPVTATGSGLVQGCVHDLFSSPSLRDNCPQQVAL